MGSRFRGNDGWGGWIPAFAGMRGGRGVGIGAVGVSGDWLGNGDQDSRVRGNDGWGGGGDAWGGGGDGG